ncbi:hypothetical protein TNCV_5005901 [Trichonephila clavipes]|nr:hypothetical protein TNCV_5005901 [Trichonephila clavipes]
MDAGVYGGKPLKANTLQSLPERPRLETGVLWSGKCFPDIFRFPRHCERHTRSIQLRICPCRPYLLLYAHCFPSGGMHLPAGQCEVLYSCKCTYVVRRAPGRAYRSSPFSKFT